MRIVGLQIERFGVWRDLSLSLDEGGLNVFYGPNEAGKSTLMRFIRGVLYGFHPDDTVAGHKERRPVRTAGVLTVEHRDRLYEIRRVSQDGGPGLVRVTESGSDEPVDEVLAELVCGTEASVFENVFAIGLQELQELATLQGADVARHIYGASLDPEARRLLAICDRAAEERRELVGSEETRGRLSELCEREREFTAEIEAAEADLVRHRELRDEQHACDEQIREIKARQSDLQYQLRGHLFLERAHEPWSRVRAARAELQAIPEIHGFPTNGLARLGEIDSELNSAVKCRGALLHEAEQFQQQASELTIDQQITTHAATMQSFVDQKGWIEQLSERTATAAEDVATESAAWAECLERLGPSWTADRVTDGDTSPGAHLLLMRAARTYQNAVGRRNRHRKRYDRLSDQYQKRLVEADRRRQELGVSDVEAAIASTRSELEKLEDLATLRLRETELKQRLIGIEDHQARVRNRLPLPKGFHYVLGAFGVVGLIFAILGIVAATTETVLGGAGYLFVSVITAGGAWTLKHHFESEIHDTLDQLADELLENETRLRETTMTIDRLTEAIRVTEDVSDAGLIRATVHRFSELEQLADLDDRLTARRHRLSRMRSHFQSIQREVHTARQAWTALLGQLGVPETLRVDEAFETWQQMAEARAVYERLSLRKSQLERRQADLASFQGRIRDLGKKIKRLEDDYNRPVEVLSGWETLLEEHASNCRQRDELRELERERRSEADVYRSSIEDFKHQRAALLIQGGAGTREEFEQRALWADRRVELTEELAEANAELQRAARSEPEMAIVEEDLVQFDGERNDEAIQSINRELEELEFDLEESVETIGGLKRDIEHLERKRDSTRLRYDREQVRAELRRLAREFFGIELADRAMERIREQYERNCRPETLAAATRHLTELSCRRQTNIWTPLGERSLCVDDDQGETFRAEELSGGTREQLFLAIRLAMVDRFAERHVELPFVLDDILVNFDQLRTEAAVNRLIDMNERGQQVLFFTCHLHLAHMFEGRGIEPIWLPRHTPPMEERRAG